MPLLIVTVFFALGILGLFMLKTPVPKTSAAGESLAEAAAQNFELKKFKVNRSREVARCKSLSGSLGQ